LLSEFATIDISETQQNHALNPTQVLREYLTAPVEK